MINAIKLEGFAALPSLSRSESEGGPAKGESTMRAQLPFQNLLQLKQTIMSVNRFTKFI
jgi:hypothetical protein